MVSPVSSAFIPQPKLSPAAADTRGKSSQSVGQQAKAAIAESGMQGLPSNIQGKVASLIARGLDPTSLLTPPPLPPTDPITKPDDTTNGTSDADNTAPPADSSSSDTVLDIDASPPPPADPALPAVEDQALSLLSPVTQLETDSSAVDILTIIKNQVA